MAIKNSPAREKAQIKYRERIRDAVLAALGRVCISCGFDDIRALQVDHINGGGHKERKGINSVTKYYKIIIESVANGEDKYQLLCANCNMIKRIINKEHK